MAINQVQSIKDSLKNKIRPAEDVVFKEFHTKEKYIEALYIKTISDETIIQDKLLKPFFEISSPDLFLDYLQSSPLVISFESEQKSLDEVIKGTAILFYQNSIFLFDSKVDRNNSVLDTTVETTIQGPQSGFSESLPTNLGLIRKRYPQTSLNVESTTVGTVSKTDVMIIHDAMRADPDTVTRIKQFLASIDVHMFQTGEQLLDIIKKSNRALVPVMLVTERPDRVAVNLAAGKIIILVSGSPFAVVLPTVMKDFMSSMEDIYQTYWVTKFLQILRYIGFLTSLVLPGLYVAVTSYNPELFRVQLALSIAGSRMSVPYPSFIEVLLMLFMMEMLTEASIRLPKAIGPTATTVGGLILGQAATEAGLVSNIMIIITSSVAISNFVIPINAFSFTLRIMKYFVLALGTLFGLVGVVVGFFMLIAYMVKLDSFGEPFLTLIQSKPSKE
ncbi:spore germination protein [Neobacillus vireti]|uniref:GerA spore germination protein n=1 Tax=Neobacillus vireti LMG 21834 TaxID=1131730 RepID=A0AB94IT62_9BACI|nr:spore germination protein [Neobacillus vireti]ETI70226.1 GerA spore germination protein [Neobacillus vireti LMG 21834]KLT19745.1 spore gernimation protein GerA [Neobacillus vireti]